MTKIKTLAAAVAIASISGFATADAPPAIYDNGPMSPAVNKTNLSPQERAAFALLEAVMQSVEGRIHSAGCTNTSMPLSVYADALVTPVVGSANLGAAPNSLGFNTTAMPSNFRGQLFNTTSGAGYIANVAVSGYVGAMVFNSANNMMVGDMTGLNVMSINWTTDQYTGKVIKDFYMGLPIQGEVPVDGVANTHKIYDWGLQALLKLNYPVEKYWQRSKTRRSNSVNGRTVFVKDRLVGVTPCRIAINLSGLNQVGVFQQSGTLAISSVVPSAAITEIDF